MASVTTTLQKERHSLLGGGEGLGASKGHYGAVSQESPRLCLIFNDDFLGGKRSAWLAKLKINGFTVEQQTPRYVAVCAPDEKVSCLAAERGSHGEHTMPATRERVLHLLLSEFEPSLGAFLDLPGPFSGRNKAELSTELRETGLVGWCWLHNKEAAQAIAPANVWSDCLLAHIREYFGSRIAWHFLYLNFLSRWMFLPALGGGSYSYVVAVSYLKSGSVDNMFVPFVGAGMVLWALLMLFFLLRLKGRYMDRWMEDIRISGTEDINTDAEMQQIVDQETGETQHFYPRWKHMTKVAVSTALLALPAGAVVLAGLGVLEARSHLVAMEPPPLGGVEAGLLCACVMYVVVHLMCFHWSGVLTHWENHTQSSDFYYAYSAKCFLFELLAHMFPVLYLAVLNLPILTGQAPANEASIMDALTIQATVVFFAYFTCCVGSHMWNLRSWSVAAAVMAEKSGSDAGPDFSYEEQALRPKYTHQIQSGLQVSVMLIYAIALAPVCPIAPALTYLWIMYRNHFDKVALVYIFQRPHPSVSNNNGFWIDSFSVILLAALLMQMPILLFCTRALSYWLPSVTLEERWGLGIFCEIVVLIAALYMLFRSRTSRQYAQHNASD